MATSCVQPLIGKALGERKDAKDKVTDEDLEPLFQWFQAHSANVAEAQRKLQAQAGLAVKPSRCPACETRSWRRGRPQRH